MKCPGCQRELKEESKFCKYCGNQIIINNPNQGVSMPQEESLPQETVPSSVRKARKGVAIGIAVILILLCSEGALNKVAAQIDRSNKITLIAMDETLRMVADDQSLITLKASDEEAIAISKDKRYLYEISEGDLYLRKGVEAPQKLDEDVESVVISEDGKTAAYLKDVEWEIGDLYMYQVGKGAQKVASEVLSEIFDISTQGKYMSYIVQACDTDDIEEAVGYIYEVGGDKREIGKVLPVMVNDRGTVVGMKITEDSDIW